MKNLTFITLASIIMISCSKTDEENEGDIIDIGIVTFELNDINGERPDEDVVRITNNLTLQDDGTFTGGFNTPEINWSYLGRATATGLPDDLYLFGEFCGTGDGCEDIYTNIWYPLYPVYEDEENSTLNVYRLIQWQDTSVDTLRIQVIRELDPYKLDIDMFFNDEHKTILIDSQEEPANLPELGGYISLQQENNN